MRIHRLEHFVSLIGEVSAKRYRYTGKEQDYETGLYYYGQVLCELAGEVDRV